MKVLRSLGQTIEGTTWLLLHVLGHALLVIGILIHAAYKGIELCISYIRTTEEQLLQRLQEKR